jgi:DNA-directed RNA polymerase specialized sigma24 family protein
MRLPELLAHFALSFTPPDDSGVASIHEGLRGRLRAAGWRPAGGRGDGGAIAWRPVSPMKTVAHRGEAFVEARIDAYQDILEWMGPRMEILRHMIRGSGDDLPPTEAEVDARLLAAFVRGDAAALDTLVERHAGRLHGQARRWLRAALAVGAVLDTFMALFERAAGLLERGDVKVGGFLFATLRLEIVRALHARGRVWFLLGRLVPSSDDDGLTARLRPDALAHHLDRACDPLEQEVMALHLDDRSDATIAAELGIPEAHVRVILRRARAELRRELDR